MLTLTSHTPNASKATAYDTTTYQSKLTRQVHRLAPISRCDVPGLPIVGAIVDDRFEILGQLGVGAMGVVLQARDLNLDRLVAIKFVHPELIERDDMLDMFVTEARLMARVRHPNVVEIYQFGLYEAFSYFVMPFVQGEDLDQWAERKGGVLAIDEIGRAHV